MGGKMKRAKWELESKIKRVDSIKNKLEISIDLTDSLEDINDAIISAKTDKIKDKIETILQQLSKTKTTQEYDAMYEELEKNEELLYLLTKKYSKSYNKAKKIEETK